MAAPLPTISIVIPVYNGARYLAEAINSALAQAYPHFDVIVVDDGSTDDTWPIVAAYGGRVRGLQQANGGVASALNTGIRAATGEYVAWLSHDDAFLPGKLLAQAACLAQQPAARLCYSDYWVVDERGQRQAVLPVPAYPRERLLRHLFQCMFICGSTVLVHRETLLHVGLFDERLRTTQDADLWLRLARRYPFVHVAEPLVHWRYHGGQGSRNEAALARDRHAYLARCLRDFELADFFPELAAARQPAQAAARARLYLARVLLERHREPGLAWAQLGLALRAWPSPQNPALAPALRLALGGWAYYGLGRRVARLLRARRPAGPVPDVDLVAASCQVDGSIE
jgi:glycosyltransferase involved in cell wall biosynthesis